jgi:hypothetical protein
MAVSMALMAFGSEMRIVTVTSMWLSPGSKVVEADYT